MSQETVKERRTAERGREKGRRTTAEPVREARWHVLVPRTAAAAAVPENAASKPRRSHTNERLAGSLKVPRKERKERARDEKKKRSSYLWQIDRSPGDDDDDERERDR